MSSTESVLYEWNEANKWLCVIFILLIVLMNGLLIAKHVKKAKFYHSPKNMIIISIAIADVILAMFPLVVQAKFSFEVKSRNDIRESCGLMVTYEIYKYYLVHFVYGVGLVTLGAEILVRHWCKFVLYKPGAAVMASCVPWFLGLVVVLPLCLTDMDYDHCMRTSHQPMMMPIASFYIPALLALVLSVSIPFITRQPRGSCGYAMTPTVMYHQTAASSSVQQGRSGPGQMSHPFLQQPQPSLEISPVDQQNTAALPQHHAAVPMTEVLPGSTDQSVNSAYTSGSVPSKEKVRLVVLTLFFIGLVSPFQSLATINSLTFFADFHKPFPLIIITSSFMLARSVVTPLITFCFIVRQTW